MNERQTKLKQNKFNRIRVKRQQGLSIQTIAAKEQVSIKYVADVLGISEDNLSIAYADVHLGIDQDMTGNFKKYSTMAWV